ncbi:hypothetical protein [Vibrio parahaemolyticus]|uniref:hypothetical protein n=1 Tax=Vibrio parahaemolyticus TaxID=670 RepID=UPI003892372C
MTMHYLRNLKSITFFGFIFCLIFSGDYYVSDLNVYLFYVVSIFSIYFIRFEKKENYYAILVYLFFLLLCVISSPIKFLEDGYYHSFVFSLIAFFCFSIYIDLFKEPNKDLVIASLLLIFVFFVIVIVNPSQTNRTSFIFGPTILYRVVLFFYGVSLIYFLKNSKYFSFIFITGVTFFCILKIGSRGGIVVMFAMLFSGLFFFARLKSLIKFIPLIIIPVLFFVDFDYVLSSRAFYFSSESESSNVRLDKLSMVYSFMDSKFSEIFFGLEVPSKLVGNYPHNIFAEILFYHGLFAFVLFSLFYSFTFIVPFLTKDREIKSIFIISLPILIGSQFSGRLLDNYFIMPIVFTIPIYYIFVSRKNEKIYSNNIV